MYVALRLSLPESIHLLSKPKRRYLYLTRSENLLLGEINSILKGDNLLLRVINVFSFSVCCSVYVLEFFTFVKCLVILIFLFAISKLVNIGALISNFVDVRSLLLNW